MSKQIKILVATVLAVCLLATSMTIGMLASAAGTDPVFAAKDVFTAFNFGFKQAQTSEDVKALFEAKAAGMGDAALSATMPGASVTYTQLINAKDNKPFASLTADPEGVSFWIHMSAPITGDGYLDVAIKAKGAGDAYASVQLKPKEGMNSVQLKWDEFRVKKGGFYDPEGAQLTYDMLGRDSAADLIFIEFCSLTGNNDAFTFTVSDFYAYNELPGLNEEPTEKPTEKHGEAY